MQIEIQAQAAAMAEQLRIDRQRMQDELNTSVQNDPEFQRF